MPISPIKGRKWVILWAALAMGQVRLANSRAIGFGLLLDPLE